MRRRSSHGLRRYAIAAVIAAIPLAAMCAAMTYLLNPIPKPVHLDFMPVVSIDQSSTNVGIADSDLYGMSDADIIKTFDEMQSLGVDTVRVLIPWGGVQPYDPSFLGGIFSGYRDWSKVDFIVNQAVSRNMAVLGVLNSTPYWGAQDGSGCLGCYGSAPDPDKFAAFAGEVAKHFGANVSAYEVWNEPNYVQSWSPAIDPVAYTEVLKAAYTAIKAQNDDALVVAGVLGTVINFGGVTMDARDFVETMYANGAHGFFDALSIHPYPYTTKFSEGGYTWWEPWKADSPLEQLIAIRQMMIDNGDKLLKIWASEYGLPTAGPNAVTEAQQSAFIKDFLDAWSKLDYTGPSFIYTTRDRLDGTTEDGSFGIFKYDWTAKAAAQIIKDWIAAHPTPTDPADPGPPDLGTQLAQALQAFFDQIRVAFQNAIDSWNSFVNSIAQAIANIFNPGGAAAASVPTSLQAEVAEGTTMAALAVKDDTSATSDTSASDAAKSASADTTETVDAAAEDVSTTTTTSEEATTTATADPKASEAASTDQKTADTEKSTTETTKSTSTETTKTTSTETTETKTSPSAQSDTSSTTGAATSTESREPTKTAVVARPTKVATGDTEGTEGSAGSGTTTSNSDTSGASTGSTTTSGSDGSDSRGAS